MKRSLLVWCLALTACASPTEPLERGSRAAGIRDGSMLLSWGSGPAEVGLRPRRTDELAQGVSAVAVGFDGAVFLLDRLNGRVLRVVPGTGEVRQAAQLPEDAEDLAAGPQGAVAAYSPLRTRVWLRDRHGEPAGEVAVPRLFRQVRRVGLEGSLGVTLHDAHQETYRLGSPAAPLTLEAALSSKREGAFLLSDGTGVAVRLNNGRPEVLQLQQGERARVKARHLLSRRVLAARVVGVSGQVVCLRLEQDGARPNEIQRRVVCLNTTSGRLLFERELPPPGLYLPRRELALGGDPARLVLIHPQQRGLRLQSWRVAP